MATPPRARESAPAPHHIAPPQHQQQQQQQQQYHHVLHHHAYTPRSISRSSGGDHPPHQPSLPAHAYELNLPTQPRPTAHRHASSRTSTSRQAPLTEHNVAVLTSTTRPQSIVSPQRLLYSDPRSSQGSLQSQTRNSFPVYPVLQISDTPRVLSSDPEKQDWSSGEHYHSTYSDEDLEDVPAHEPTTNVLKALMHLSFCAPFLSLATTLYTILVLVYSSLASIAALCTSRPSFRDTTTTLLAKPLRLHLRCVCAPASSLQREHKSLAKHLGPLVCTQLLSPLAALPMAMAGWVVAIFWTLSALIADEGGNGDGKTLAMTLADWWIWWLEGRAFR